MRRIAILILALAISGCVGTMTDLARGKGSTLDTYGVQYEELWQLATTVITNYGLNITQFNKEQGYIQAARGMTIFSNGEMVAIYITPIDKENQVWRVEAVYVPKIKSQVFAPNLGSVIISKIEEILRGRS